MIFWCSFCAWHQPEPISAALPLPSVPRLWSLPAPFASIDGIQSIVIIALLGLGRLSSAATDSLPQPVYVLKLRPAITEAEASVSAAQGGETLERSPAMKLILKRILDSMDTEEIAKPIAEIQTVKLAPSPVPHSMPSGKQESDRSQSPAPDTISFEILATDETLFLALRRWTTTQGVQLIWDAGKDFPARNTAYPAKDLHEAIEMVMVDTERSNYPLHACSYANRVIRILHVSQACQRL